MRLRVPAFRALAFAPAVALLCGVAARTDAEGPRAPAETPAPRGPAAARAARLPVRFEPNLGQTDSRFAAVARADGCVALLASDGATVRTRCGDFVMRIDGADGRVRTERPQPGRANYLRGADPARWVRDVPHFSEAVLGGARPGVDVRWRGDDGALRFDFECDRADRARSLTLSIDGAAAEIAPDGTLALRLTAGTATLSAPVAWQEVGGARVAVECRWSARGAGRVGFDLGAHDPTAPLVIDPTMHAASLLGTSSNDAAACVATDATGAVYLGGSTFSSAFPATTGVVQTAKGDTSAASDDGFVAALSGDMTALLWATYLGGDGNDAVNDVVLEAQGGLTLCGRTSSSDFPVPAGSSPAATSGAGFVARISADGATLAASTYSARAARRVGVDLSGNVIVLAEGSPALVEKMGSSLAAGSGIWSTTLSPTNGAVTGTGLAVDAAGMAWCVGFTTTTTSYATGDAYDSSWNGGAADAFLWRCEASDGTASYRSFLGGSGDDRAEDIAFDGAGALLVCGTTASSNFPVRTAFQGTKSTGTDGFVAKFDPALSGVSQLTWSSFLGGTGTDSPHAVTVHANSAVYVAGDTTSAASFPLTNAIQSTFGGGASDAFGARIAPSGTLVWSTYRGGSGADTGAAVAVGPEGRPVFAGLTASTNFPTTSGAFAASNAGGNDVVAWSVEESTAPFGNVSYLDLSTIDVEATEGIYLNVTLPLNGGRAPLTWTLHSGAVPPGMRMVAGVVDLAPGAGSAGVHRFTVRVTDADGACVTREYGLLVHAAPRITGGPLADWTVDAAMSQSIGVSGGRPPLTWHLPEGETCAPGTSVDVTGRVAGFPSQTGDSTWEVVVSDRNGASDRRAISLHVNPRPVVGDVSFDEWTEGRPYSRTFTATLGSPPYSWSLDTGTLAVDASIGASTGTLSGLVRAAGDYDFTVAVTDAAGARETRAFSMHVNQAPVITSDVLPLALVEREYAATLTSALGTGTRRWFVTGEGDIPVGFVLDGYTGRFGGRPLVARDFDFEMRVLDDANASAKRFLRLTVVPFFDLSGRRNAVTDTFAGDGTDAPARRFVELLAGSRLDGEIRLVGKGALGARIRIVDADTGDEVALDGLVRTRGRKSTLRGLTVTETRRLYVIVEPDEGFAGSVETVLRATPRAAWSGKVAVAPEGTPVEIRVAALAGARLTVTLQRAKRSAALPTVVSVLDDHDNELLDAADVRLTKKGAILRLARELPLGDVRVLVTGRPEGGAGECTWKASLRSPSAYDVRLYDRPAGETE